MSFSRKYYLEIGSRFGRFIVLNEVDNIENSTSRWYKVKCDCGIVKNIRLGDLVHNKVRSCGCLKKEADTKRFKKHGLSRTRTYKIWMGINKRCNNINSEHYVDYGGRGIKIDPYWYDYTKFLSDMGECPGKEYSINRIDNNGNYTATNCKWSTQKEQCRNKRNNVLIEYKGKTQCQQAWAEELGIHYFTLHRRLKMGWAIEDALTNPTKKKKCKIK